MSEAFLNKQNLMKEGEGFLHDTYSTTMNSMNTAFGLATALAWNEAIKAIIQNVMPKGSGHTQLVMYAVFVTVVYVLFMMLSNKKQERVGLAVAKLA
jgi:hypothetical protein